MSNEWAQGFVPFASNGGGERQVVISAQNRNFPGRSGPGQMYLASQLTVAASAVAGYIVEYEPSNANDLVSA